MANPRRSASSGGNRQWAALDARAQRQLRAAGNGANSFYTSNGTRYARTQDGVTVPIGNAKDAARASYGAARKAAGKSTG